MDLLLDRGYTVIGVARSPESTGAFLRYKSRRDLSKYSYLQMDLNKDVSKLLALLDAEKPPYIVNFAALCEVALSWEYPEQWLATNALAVACLVNHLRRRDFLERYVQISTPEVYGTCSGRVLEDTVLNPSTPYAVSKATADLLLETYRRQFGFPVLTVRSTNVYGARQRINKIIPRTIIFMRLGKEIELHGGGKAIKSFISIRDVSEGELGIMENGNIGDIYHLSPDESISIHDLVRKICEKMGKDFGANTRIISERPGQDAAYVIDSTKARRNLGWAPKYSLDQGVDEVIHWVDENWDEIRRLPLEYVHQF